MNLFLNANQYHISMTDLKSLLKTTPKYIALLAKNGIVTVQDLLQYFPRTYEDRSNLKMLDELTQSEKVMVKGNIIKKNIFFRGGKRIYDIRFVDERGNTWYISIFNSWFLASKIEEGKRYLIIGKPAFKFWKIIFSHPDVVETVVPEEDGITPNPSLEKEGNIDATHRTGRIYPIYPELNGISAGWFAQKIWKLLPYVEGYFKEYLPEEFLAHFALLGVQETIKEIHFPTSMELQQKAIQRVFFDRLLRVQLHSLINKQLYQKQYKKYDALQSWETIKDIVATLPFTLTNAQKKVIKQLVDNTHDDKPMMRLLQWDVGSWKTVVAAIVAYYAHKIFQGQSVFLAPLEVLANQHYRTLAKLFLPLGLRVELLTGALTKGQKDKIKSDLKQGHIHVLIGTHAILQEDVDFRDLKFIVIDEQHKFGVRQRAFFRRFGSPHILQMSATPIPRSMALAFFWEFDVSIIDELPVGRKPIITKMVSEKEYFKLKSWISTKVEEWQKVFIVTPLIEESEKMEELKSAMVEYQNAQELFPELKDKIWLLHGRMKSAEKEQVMQDFKSGKLQVLVSTTVIEVWVDVPEATIMVIKNAERFGLSQLHQLRWRIGRSDLQSYCFLETKNKSSESAKRLKAMEETNDGFKLAELDLHQRGAGEILGTMQSGECDIPMTILSDLKFLERVQEWAQWILERYPNLDWLAALKKHIQEKVGDFLA